MAKRIAWNTVRYGKEKVEKKIGDHLIEKGVPILDFYSHRLGGR